MDCGTEALCLEGAQHAVQRADTDRARALHHRRRPNRPQNDGVTRSFAVAEVDRLVWPQPMVALFLFVLSERLHEEACRHAWARNVILATPAGWCKGDLEPGDLIEVSLARLER